MSLIIILLLILYFVFTLLFTVFFQEISDRQLESTRTPVPTFTPAPSTTAFVVAVVTPETPTPSSTPTPTSSPTPEVSPTVPTATPTPTITPTPVRPRVVASTTVNVRSGPGTNYPVIDALPPNIPLPVIGRNEQATWWQVQGPDGSVGWVADSVVEAKNIEEVPTAQAPPPPQPTDAPIPVPATPVPPTTYQYEPTGWYGDTNYGLTRFLGTITDVDGNPVNGVFVEAQCGDFRVISNPSGPVGWGPFNESHTWPPGFYDITLDTKPIPCVWFLTVVETPDRETVTARVSESIRVETTIDQSIIVADWRKNW